MSDLCHKFRFSQGIRFVTRYIPDGQTALINLAAFSPSAQCCDIKQITFQIIGIQYKHSDCSVQKIRSKECSQDRYQLAIVETLWSLYMIKLHLPYIPRLDTTATLRSLLQCTVDSKAVAPIPIYAAVFQGRCCSIETTSMGDMAYLLNALQLFAFYWE